MALRAPAPRAGALPLRRAAASSGVRYARRGAPGANVHNAARVPVRRRALVHCAIAEPGVAGATSNGNGATHGSNGNGSGSVALMKLGTAPSDGALVAAPASEAAFAFDENAPVVAEAPGGQWSRFKSYSVFAVRAAATCAWP